MHAHLNSVNGLLSLLWVYLVIMVKFCNGSKRQKKMSRLAGQCRLRVYPSHVIPDRSLSLPLRPLLSPLLRSPPRMILLSGTGDRVSRYARASLRNWMRCFAALDFNPLNKHKGKDGQNARRNARAVGTDSIPSRHVTCHDRDVYGLH